MLLALFTGYNSNIYTRNPVCGQHKNYFFSNSSRGLGGSKPHKYCFFICPIRHSGFPIRVAPLLPQLGTPHLSVDPPQTGVVSDPVDRQHISSQTGVDLILIRKSNHVVKAADHDIVQT